MKLSYKRKIKNRTQRSRNGGTKIAQRNFLCGYFAALRLCVSFWVLITIAAIAGEKGRASFSPLLQPGMDTVVVARVGNLDITAEEFLLSYECGPAFVKKRDNAKARHLDFMIYEKLLALDGYTRGFEKDQRVSATLKEMEGDLATEELYRDEVLSQVSVDQKEIEEAIAKERIQLELRWLFTSNREQLNQYQQRLAQGASFDSLFITQLRDSVFADERSLSVTRFRLEDRNPEMARVVDTLAFGAVSQPITAPDGFYLVQVTNISTNPVMTETEAAKLEYDLEHALIKRKAEALSDQYVDRMMRERDPVIVRQTFNVLRAMLGKSILPPEKYNDWNLAAALMSEAGPLDSVKAKDYRTKTLVKLTGENFLLEDFWTWYQARQPYIRFNTASPQSYFASLQQIVWRSVRDKLLIDRAFQRGLQNRPNVQRQKKWWEEKSIYARAKAELMQSLHLTDEQMQRFYAERNRQYNDKQGKVLPFDRVKEQVREDCYAEELTKRTLHYVNQLKSKYPVQINQSALDRLPVSAESDPQAIDFIVAKKGGTFPRPGFPTIDFDWKKWE